MRIAMPAHMQSSLIFHYNLKFYDTEGDGFDGVSLKRFVMQVPAKFNFLLHIDESSHSPDSKLPVNP